MFSNFLRQSIVAFIAFSKYWINIQIDNISIYIISSSSQNAFLLIVYCWRKTVKCRERALVVTFYDIAARSDGRENRIPRRECLQSWSWSFVDKCFTSIFKIPSLAWMGGMVFKDPYLKLNIFADRPCLNAKLAMILHKIPCILYISMCTKLNNFSVDSLNVRGECVRLHCRR